MARVPLAAAQRPLALAWTFVSKRVPSGSAWALRRAVRCRSSGPSPQRRWTAWGPGLAALVAAPALRRCLGRTSAAAWAQARPAVAAPRLSRLLSAGGHSAVAEEGAAEVRPAASSVPGPAPRWDSSRCRQRAAGVARWAEPRSAWAGNLAGPLRHSALTPGFPRCLPVDPGLTQGGGCLHIPSLGCDRSDKKFVRTMLADISAQGNALRPHRSGRHLQAWGDQLMGSTTFTAIVARLLTVFDLSLVDCWLNVYRNGCESKSWHFDNYQDRVPNPTVTIGLSLGAARELCFEHAPMGQPTGQTFSVLQRNGDVFAFDETFNRHFRHAVPTLAQGEDEGLRISVIIWALEGRGLAVPRVVRSGPGIGPAKEIRWDRWDLDSGLFCDSHIFA